MVKDLRKRVLPALDDEFAKDVGEFETLEALRDRVLQDLQREAEAEADRNLRSDLMKELAARVTVDIPESLVERELDRRTEEFARRLMDQNIDPRQANIDWDQFRDSQREASRESVKSALALDEISRREDVTVSDEDVESRGVQVAGFVIREASPVASNWRAKGSLRDYLVRYGIVAIADIDTRALTRVLRSSGVMRGIIATGQVDGAVC